MSDLEKNMFIFICDISGYTRFMLKNETDYTHGILLISKVLNSLVKEINFPMRISKLEGDAIFFYLLEEEMPEAYKKDPLLLGQHMLNFYTVFYSKIAALQDSTDCLCGACSNLAQLDLKIIIHFGKAAIIKIGSFQELNGVPVIVAHRLLKNTIDSHCYILVSEAAYAHLRLSSDVKVELSRQQVKDIGSFPVYVYFPVINKTDRPKKIPTALTLKKTHFLLFLGNLLLKLHLKRIPHFLHLPQPKKLKK